MATIMDEVRTTEGGKPFLSDPFLDWAEGEGVPGLQRDQHRSGSDCLLDVEHEISPGSIRLIRAVRSIRARENRG